MLCCVEAEVVPNHTRSNRLNETQAHTLSPSEAAIIARWRAEGHVWPCIEGTNDDWYWLYATVVVRGCTSNPPHAPSGRGQRQPQPRHRRAGAPPPARGRRALTRAC
jgi:hypothetical protein